MAEDLDKIMNMTELPSRYNHLLKEEGVDEGNTQSHLLKARLQHHFGSTLSFRRPKKWNETQYVFSSSLNPGPLTEHTFTLEAAEQQREEEEINTATSSQSPVVNINALPAAPHII